MMKSRLVEPKKNAMVFEMNDFSQWAFWVSVLALTSCAGVDPYSEESMNQKVMALQEKFDRFDYNADGYLTRGEIVQGLEDADVEGVTKQEINLVMKHYDFNADGKISRVEVQRAIDSPLPQEVQEIIEAQK